MRKSLKVVSSRPGSSPVCEQIVDDKGSPRRFTKKGAFCFLRTHGDRTKIKITDGRDCWLAVLEGELR